jgi:penicillin amidase
VAPPENLIWADTSGATGWAATGLTPVRAGWDGLMPVPGDGRYEWRGFIPGDQLPAIRNPAKGWIATANEMNLPADYPAQTRPTAFEWGDRSRIDRIDEVLAANPHVSVADSMALQTDSHAAIARRLLALAAPLSSDNPRLADALARLRAWNTDEATDSVAASLYEVWSAKHLGRAVVRREAPAAASIIGSGALDAVLFALEHPGPALGPDPEAARREILLSSLGEAIDELTARLGPDMSRWTWGRLHHATFTPAIAAEADAALAARMTLGPIAVPGGPSTPKAAAYDLSTFEVTHGASVRMVMDVGAWDNSMIVNTPGQSADPDSPHYGDLFPMWAHGAYVPMLYSRPAVEAAAETVITLEPTS